MGREFPLKPQTVPHVNTRHRRIQTPIPVPESLPLLEEMRLKEPRSMGGQPPIIWDHGEGFQVCDPYGNKWIDFSSGVLVTASGHHHPRIVEAIVAEVRDHLYHAYCFPTSIRARLVAKVVSLLPPPLEKIFLLSTGSEAVECCIKLARTYGLRKFGKEKSVIVSFEHAFHGRTMGSQLAGGMSAQKEWLGDPDPRFAQVPFPDGFRNPDESFAGFERSLERKGIAPDRVCAVLTETYQGVNAKMWTMEYAQAMRGWCDRHQAALIFDEIQAGFGRTGRWFGFEHLGIVPDLAAFGKGIAGGMPLSAVVGRKEFMDLYNPGEMTSTHSANPLCCAAALANIEVIEREGLVENAARLESVLRRELEVIRRDSRGQIGRTDAIGLVGAMQFVRPGTKSDPDADAAWEATKKAVESGVMLFAPVGVGGSAIKVNPPLGITEDALLEGLGVLRDAVSE